MIDAMGKGLLFAFIIYGSLYWSKSFIENYFYNKLLKSLFDLEKVYNHLKSMPLNTEITIEGVNLPDDILIQYTMLWTRMRENRIRPSIAILITPNTSMGNVKIKSIKEEK